MARYQVVLLMEQAVWRVLVFRGSRYQALYEFSAQADQQRLLLKNLQRYPAAKL
jgi:hypothetical protein